MKNDRIKCSSKKHSDNDAINYCQECRINLCNKCEKLHSELFENHHQYKIDKDSSEIFTGFCKEPNHLEKLSFFCKDHNELCCSSCVTKIKDNRYGKHANCKICFIEDIKEEKKGKLKENINNLENLSSTLNESINKLKKIFEKINENKEELKLKVQKIFTKLRNTINEREDKLLLEIDNTFNNLYLKDEFIKETEKLPNKVKESLEKGKNLDKEWVNDNSDLKSVINNCLNIENNIKSINYINENMIKFNWVNLNIKFLPEDEGINDFIQKIINFGNISNEDGRFKFQDCPLDISENRKYSVSGELGNILTKTGTDYEWMGTICKNTLKNEENKWKIKILKTKYNTIMVGVAPVDFDIKSSLYDNCGWYYRCSNSKLYSGPPHNYMPKLGKQEKQKSYTITNYEIIVIMNLIKKTIKFIVNGEDKGELYSEIPTDKPLTPAVFLFHKDDSIEIINC